MSTNLPNDKLESKIPADIPMQVLLIEDTAIDAHLIQAYIKKMPGALFNVLWESRLADGLDRLKDEDIDLVLLDLCLPDSQDLDSLKRVQDQVSDVPIIVLTGLNDEEIAVEAVKCGAQDYLVKGQVDSFLLSRAMRYAIERNNAEKKIRNYQEQLRELTAEVSLTEERERRRIAQDLHDHIGQSLVLAKMKLLSLHTICGDDVIAPVEEVNELINDAIRYTRSLTAELSPPVLYELGLEAAIQWYAEQMQMRHGIKVTVEVGDNQIPLADEMRGLLFRAVRELLHNVIKHAKAENVIVRVAQHAEGIMIEITDDGVGFNAKPEIVDQHGYGLFSIQERLRYIDGSLTINSAPGKGASAIIIAPQFC